MRHALLTGAALVREAAEGEARTRARTLAAALALNPPGDGPPPGGSGLDHDAGEAAAMADHYVARPGR